MGAPKKKKRSELKNRRFINVHEDKGLTQKEQQFVYEYVKCKNGYEAVLLAGYSPKGAKQRAYTLTVLKPNTVKAIRILRAKLFERLEHDVFDVMQGTCWVAMADATKLTPIKDGRVLIPDTSEYDNASKALFAGAKERVNEKGQRTIEVKMHDQLAAKKMMLELYGAMEKSRKAQQEPLEEQKSALAAVRSGDKGIIEACCYLEEQGIPLPETLRILLTKHAESEETEDDSGFQMPTAEQMAEKREKRLAEVEDQKKTFLPERQEDVRGLKEEMGDKSGWDEQGKGGPEDG